jgi:hypothetical protein
MMYSSVFMLTCSPSQYLMMPVVETHAFSPDAGELMTPWQAEKH